MTMSPEDYFDSLTEAEQDRIFTKAGAEAIRNGADIGQVVNARRGMSRAQSGRIARDAQGLYTTRAGRRGSGRGVRLMPESIREIAGGDRDEYVRLLKVHGYVL